MNPISISGGGMTTFQKPVMIFIDGGYLRRKIEEHYNAKEEEINFSGLQSYLLKYAGFPHTIPEIRRTFYYDAIVDIEKDAEKYKHQKEFFDKIDGYELYEVRLGIQKKDGKGKPRQKGTDVLLTIDMITKAYENHYDIAVFFGADVDFFGVIKAVKNAGKIVVGVFFDDGSISNELRKSFDRQVPIRFNEDNDSRNKAFRELVLPR